MKVQAPKIKEFKGHSVKVVDLYSPEYELPFLKFKSLETIVPTKKVKEMQKLITWAHEIVMVHPIWWSSPPAIMKNWIDHTFAHGFAYKFDEKGKEVGLLKGKTAKIFTTSGGPGWIYKIPFFLPLSSFWHVSLFNFVGIELVDFKTCGNLNTLKDEELEIHFKKFLKKIRESA